jgi:hypothetical protein
MCIAPEAIFATSKCWNYGRQKYIIDGCIFSGQYQELSFKISNYVGVVFYMQRVTMEHMVWTVIFIVERAWIQNRVTTWMEHV